MENLIGNKIFGVVLIIVLLIIWTHYCFKDIED